MRQCYVLMISALLLVATAVRAQTPAEQLLHEMRQYEKSVISIYRAYQWLFYEEKQSRAELLSFENLLGVYVKRLQQAYDTVLLIGQDGVEAARDITSRAYVYRALTFLEKAPVDFSYFERACYDYYEALQLYNGTEDVPAIFKPLEEPLRVGGKSYTRLIDLLHDKGNDLFAFGQVHLLLQNFKVTSKFPDEGLRLVRQANNVGDSLIYTYRIAEARLREGFERAFQSQQPVNVYLALPAGTYIVRSGSPTAPNDYVDLAKIYVRPNQFISYIVEPIADWVIFYETPEYLLRSAELGHRAIPASAELVRLEEAIASKVAQQVSNRSGWPTDSAGQLETREGDIARNLSQAQAVLEEVLDAMPLHELEALPILRTRKEFIERVAEAIVQEETGEYLSSWNRWTFAWRVASKVNQMLNPRGQVAMPLVRLVYQYLGASK